MEESRAPKRGAGQRWNLAPGQPKPPVFKRAKRPGQRAPSAPKGMMGVLPPRGGLSAPRADNDEPSDHQLDMERKQAAFDQVRPENIKSYCEYARKRLELRLETETAVAVIRQGAVDKEAEALLKEPCPCCGGKVEKVKMVREVEVIEFECRHVLKVPEFVCRGAACTRRSFSVSPFVAGCSPSAPTIDCPKWVTIGVLNLFGDLQLNNGLSGAGELFSFSILSSVYLTVLSLPNLCSFRARYRQR
jgi:hypothetical protein